MLMQFVFDFFRTHANELHVLAAALGTLARNFLRVVAIMAEHAAVAAMICQRDGTIDAFQPLAASAARGETRKASPVQQ